MTSNRDDGRRAHRAEDVRGGEIVLRSRRRRILFIGGLIGIILLGLVVRLILT